MAKKDHLIFENVNVVRAFKNFSGRYIPPYNPKGMRKFNIEIDDIEFAEQLVEDGWNIKFDNKEREDGKKYLPHMEVKVKYHDDPDKKGLDPRIQMRMDTDRVELTEENIHTLDEMDITNVRYIDIAPHEWVKDDGSVGYTAYLSKMIVEVARDIFNE